MELTMQQAFDQAYAGVMAQGKKSLSQRGGCAYRGNNGGKCGVGHLITDAEYKNSMDNPGSGASSSIRVVIDQFPPRIRALPLDFLASIQAAHDSCGRGWDRQQFKPEFHNRMVNIAKDWKLALPEPLKEAA